MAFQKGQSGNPNGRKKGAVNKVTKQQKESIQWVMERLEDSILDDIKSVHPSRRLQLYTDLMNYIKPKLSATKVDADVNNSGDLNITVKYKNFNTPDEDQDNDSDNGSEL